MTRLETKVNRLLKGKKVKLSGEEYIEASKKGLLCGIVGCLNKPEWQCPRCGHYYCGQHKNIHLHQVGG